MQRLRNLLNRLSVGQKVMTVIIVEVISYSMVTTIALSQIHTVGMELKQMADLYLPLFSSTESTRQQIQEGRLNLKEIIFVGDRVVYDQEAEETYVAARVRYEDGNTDINQQISWAENMIRRSVLQQTDNDSVVNQYSERLVRRLSDIRQANRIHHKRVQKIFRHVEDGSFLMGMEMLDEVSDSESALTVELDNLVADLEELKKASVSYATKLERTASGFTILASILTVCVVITIFYFVVKRNITKPLHSLTDAISSFDTLREIKETDTEKELMTRGDELGMLGRSFNQLKHDLFAQGQDLRAAKEKAEQADRAKTQFLAAASHDLRQPLHAMQMYIAALRSKVSDREVLGVVSDIDSVSVSAGRMLNALLDVSQLEAGAIKPQIEDFAIQEVLVRVARAFTPLAQHNGLDLRLVPTAAVVRSDPVLLERIIGNFVTNAIHYTEHGSVLIGCRRRGAQLSVEILDTGPGVPEEQALAIFEDFHQLNNEERDRGKGLGLGLAIVRRLCTALGHRIEHSSQLGRGSRFAVLVECGNKLNQREEEEQQLDHHLLDFHGTTIVLIEDDATVMRATRQLLELWECSVLCARSTEEALSVVAQSPVTPDVIIADYRLPGGLDGLEAITRIQLALGVAIPAVIITGEAEASEIRGIAVLGYRVMRKPVRPARLRRLLTHILSQSPQVNTVEQRTSVEA